MFEGNNTNRIPISRLEINVILSTKSEVTNSKRTSISSDMFRHIYIYYAITCQKCLRVSMRSSLNIYAHCDKEYKNTIGGRLELS